MLAFIQCCALFNVIMFVGFNYLIVFAFFPTSFIKEHARKNCGISILYRALVGDRNDSRYIFNTPSRVRENFHLCGLEAQRHFATRAAKLFI